MRLLFDEQLSDTLPALLADVFPGSLHVCVLVGVGVSDELVWECRWNTVACWSRRTRTSTA
jgi:hypothetical protein